MAGYVGLDDPALLKRMIEVQKHRGPDDVGFYTGEHVGLANARLSIIDIEGGHQPLSNENGTVHATYNGEIYNFRELRQKLESNGHRFSTQSDTEVIVHSYEQYGDDFLPHLNGMFALALWDSKNRKLILARDRMGIKPLHYAVRGGVLLFASEFKGILEHSISRTVDTTSLYELLNLGYIPGDRTLIEGIRKLPPSTSLVHESGSIRITNYWTLPPVDEAADETVIAARLRRALQESISSQLVADVPVGCFLSGGLDTSTIVAFAAASSNQPIKTFCMGFGEETDEFEDARLIADHFNTDHHEIIVDKSQALKLYPKMIWHMEAPKYNLYPWFVCELVRKHVKVCLSGNGGDEAFGGYVARYDAALRIANLGYNAASGLMKASGRVLEPFATNNRIRNRLRALGSLGDNTSEYLILAGVLPDSINRRLFLPPAGSFESLKSRFAPYLENSDFLQGIMRAELRTKLVDDLLSVDDSMSMAHSLETRVPLLDNRILDALISVPWHLSFSPGRRHGKMLLRRIVSELLPGKTFTKPKWGFTVNVSAWYKGELGELARQVIPESEVLRQYFSLKDAAHLLSKANHGERRFQVLAWQLLGFHFWHRLFIDSEKPGAGSLEVGALVA